MGRGVNVSLLQVEEDTYGEDEDEDTGFGDVREKSVPLFSVEACSSSERLPSSVREETDHCLYKGKSLSLLHRKEADSMSLERIELFDPVLPGYSLPQAVGCAIRLPPPLPKRRVAKANTS